MNLEFFFSCLFYSPVDLFDAFYIFLFLMELNILMSKLRLGLVWVASQFSWPISCLASVISVGDILSSRLLLFCRGMCPSFLMYSSCPIPMFSFDYLISSPRYWNLATSSDFTPKRVRILLMTLFLKVSDPAKQKSLTCVAIMLWSLFSKNHVTIARSYFISSSLSVRYLDREASVRLYTHLDNFRM